MVLRTVKYRVVLALAAFVLAVQRFNAWLVRAFDGSSSVPVTASGHGNAAAPQHHTSTAIRRWCHTWRVCRLGELGIVGAAVCVYVILLSAAWMFPHTTLQSTPVIVIASETNLHRAVLLRHELVSQGFDTELISLVITRDGPSHDNVQIIMDMAEKKQSVVILDVSELLNQQPSSKNILSLSDPERDALATALWSELDTVTARGYMAALGVYAELEDCCQRDIPCPAASDVPHRAQKAMVLQLLAWRHSLSRHLTSDRLLVVNADLVGTLPSHFFDTIELAARSLTPSWAALLVRGSADHYTQGVAGFSSQLQRVRETQRSPGVYLLRRDIAVRLMQLGTQLPSSMGQFLQWAPRFTGQTLFLTRHVAFESAASQLAAQDTAARVPAVFHLYQRALDFGSYAVVPLQSVRGADPSPADLMEQPPAFDTRSSAGYACEGESWSDRALMHDISEQARLGAMSAGLTRQLLDMTQRSQPLSFYAGQPLTGQPLFKVMRCLEMLTAVGGVCLDDSLAITGTYFTWAQAMSEGHLVLTWSPEESRMLEYELIAASRHSSLLAAIVSRAKQWLQSYKDEQVLATLSTLEAQKKALDHIFAEAVAKCQSQVDQCTFLPHDVVYPPTPAASLQVFRFNLSPYSVALTSPRVVPPQHSIVTGGYGPIPKIFHAIVLGQCRDLAVKVERALRSWLRYHPGWRLRLWTDDSIARENLSLQPLIDRAESFAQKSDLARIELVAKYGGVYIDADLECFQSWEPLLQGASLVGCHEDGTDSLSRALTNTMFGASKNHPVMQKLVRLYHSVILNTPDVNMKSGPAFLRRAIDADIASMRLLPSRWIYPVRYSEREVLTAQDCYQRSCKFFGAYSLHLFRPEGAIWKSGKELDTGRKAACDQHRPRFQSLTQLEGVVV